MWQCDTQHGLVWKLLVPAPATLSSGHIWTLGRFQVSLLKAGISYGHFPGPIRVNVLLVKKMVWAGDWYTILYLLWSLLETRGKEAPLLINQPVGKWHLWAPWCPTGLHVEIPIFRSPSNTLIPKCCMSVMAKRMNTFSLKRPMLFGPTRPKDFWCIASAWCNLQ